MSWLITNVIAAFLLPPLSFLLLGIAGVVLFKRRPRVGRLLVVGMLVLLWVFSLPVVGNRLLAMLERGAHTPVGNMHDAQAIVVLGGGTYLDAPEYGGDTVGGAALERLRLAAMLYRHTGLPLLTAGGNPDGGKLPEAVLMKKTLEEEFAVPVRWLETASNNTRQSAINSRELLAATGVRTIVLVTHGWHMPRARRIFERAGFRVMPAGTGFHADEKLTVLSFLPRASGLNNSAVFMHEAVGLLWYRLAPLPPAAG